MKKDTGKFDKNMELDYVGKDHACLLKRKLLIESASWMRNFICTGKMLTGASLKRRLQINLFL